MEVRVSSFPSGILCIIRFQSRAVCRETCAWYVACRRVVPSESMETSRRIWKGRSFAEDSTVPVLSVNVFPQSLHIHLWCLCSFPCFLIWLWQQYRLIFRKGWPQSSWNASRKNRPSITQTIDGSLEKASEYLNPKAMLI